MLRKYSYSATLRKRLSSADLGVRGFPFLDKFGKPLPFRSKLAPTGLDLPYATATISTLCLLLDSSWTRRSKSVQS